MNNYNATLPSSSFRRVNTFSVDYGDAQSGNMVKITVIDNLAAIVDGKVMSLPNTQRTITRYYPLTDFALWGEQIGMVSNTTGLPYPNEENQEMTSRVSALRHCLAVIREEQVTEDENEDSASTATPPLVSGTV
jgi:hypothetical protein